MSLLFQFSRTGAYLSAEDPNTIVRIARLLKLKIRHLAVLKRIMKPDFQPTYSYVSIIQTAAVH